MSVSDTMSEHTAALIRGFKAYEQSERDRCDAIMFMHVSNPTGHSEAFRNRWAPVHTPFDDEPMDIIDYTGDTSAPRRVQSLTIYPRSECLTRRNADGSWRIVRQGATLVTNLDSDEIEPWMKDNTHGA